jgi:hypothetical protein
MRRRGWQWKREDSGGGSRERGPMRDRRCGDGENLTC